MSHKMPFQHCNEKCLPAVCSRRPRATSSRALAAAAVAAAAAAAAVAAVHAARALRHSARRSLSLLCVWQVLTVARVDEGGVSQYVAAHRQRRQPSSSNATSPLNTPTAHHVLELKGDSLAVVAGRRGCARARWLCMWRALCAVCIVYTRARTHV
jgi:hypothetical protein